MLHKALTVPCQKSQIIFYDSSRVKSGVVSPVRFKFPVKLICCIASGSASSTYCFLKSIANFFKWNMINEVKNQLYSHLFDQYNFFFFFFFWVLFVHMLSFVCSYVTFECLNKRVSTINFSFVLLEENFLYVLFFADIFQMMKPSNSFKTWIM